MDDRQVAKWADDIVFSETGKHLDHIQQSILRGTWQRQKYPEIAENCQRSRAHVRKEASKLWKILSETLGEDINQSNFRSTAERWQFSNFSITGNGCVQIGKVSTDGSLSFTVPEPTQKNEDILNKPTENAKLTVRQDLADAPEPNLFYNRTPELTTLENWILGRTRLITILGLSGIGKTALTLQLISQIQHEFDYIIWRSLRNAPPLASLETDLIKFLSQQQETNPPNPPLSRGGAKRFNLFLPGAAKRFNLFLPPLARGGWGG